MVLIVVFLNMVYEFILKFSYTLAIIAVEILIGLFFYLLKLW